MTEARSAGPAAQAFGRDRRIRKKAEFDRTFQEGRRVTSPHFVFVFAPRADDSGARASRLGLVVSRKAGNAITRNRIKRLCREAFRRAPQRLPADVGLDVVLIPRPGAAELDFAHVDAEFEEALRKIRNVVAGLAKRPGVTHLPSRSRPPQGPQDS